MEIVKTVNTWAPNKAQRTRAKAQDFCARFMFTILFKKKGLQWKMLTAIEFLGEPVTYKCHLEFILLGNKLSFSAAHKEIP